MVKLSVKKNIGTLYCAWEYIEASHFKQWRALLYINAFQL